MYCTAKLYATKLHCCFGHAFPTRELAGGQRYYYYFFQFGAEGSALVTCTVLTDFKGRRYLHSLQLGLRKCNSRAPKREM